jgi:phosphopantetheine adenylyltransferase
MRKNKDYDNETKKTVYGEIFKLSINPKVLIGGNLMVEFIKDQDYKEVSRGLRSRHKEFGIT